MKVAEGYFCLVQYCPDAARAEAANLGVLVFSPAHGFLEAKTASGNDRARRFFKGDSFSKEYLDAAKSAFCERVAREQDHIRSLDDLLAFIGGRGNDLVVTPPRSMRTENPKAELQRLFDELVGGRASGERRRSIGRSTLKRAFTDLQTQGLAELDLTVHIPKLDQYIEIPFAYLNGRQNLIKTMHVDLREPLKSKNIACRVSTHGRLLSQSRDSSGRSRRLVVVNTVPVTEGGESLEAAIGSVFEENDVKFVRERDIANFLVDVKNEAHK